MGGNEPRHSAAHFSPAPGVKVQKMAPQSRRSEHALPLLLRMTFN